MLRKRNPVDQLHWNTATSYINQREFSFKTMYSGAVINASLINRDLSFISVNCELTFFFYFKTGIYYTYIKSLLK